MTKFLIPEKFVGDQPPGPEGEDHGDGGGEGGRDQGQDDGSIQEESPAFGQVGPNGREGEEKPEDRPEETDEGRQKEAVPEGLALVRIAEDIENVGQAKSFALLEGRSGEVDQGEENEEDQESPENDQTGEEGRVSEKLSETNSWDSGSRRKLA